MERGAFRGHSVQRSSAVAGMALRERMSLSYARSSPAARVHLPPQLAEQLLHLSFAQR